jgi:hypothetical protein
MTRIRFLGEGFSLFATASRPALWPTQPHIKWVVPGTLFSGVKRPGSEADDPPPSTAEVKNAWSYTYTPHTSSRRGFQLSTGYVFMARCLGTDNTGDGGYTRDHPCGTECPRRSVVAIRFDPCSFPHFPWSNAPPQKIPLM